MKSKVINLYEKVPVVIRYLIKGLIYGFCGLGISLLLIFLILNIAGKYDALASALNLRYNSPWIKYPIFISVGAFVLLLAVAVLVYLYRYKRSVGKTRFGTSYQKLLKDESVNR